MAVSARTAEGIEGLWKIVERHRQATAEAGLFEECRLEQTRRWLWRLVREGLIESFRDDEANAAQLARLEAAVLRGEKTAAQAAEEILAAQRPN